MKIATKKTDYSSVSSRVGSTANMDHKPGGGEKKVSLTRNMLVTVIYFMDKEYRNINISSIGFSVFLGHKENRPICENMTMCFNMN